jgi:hypothetical protein
VVVAAVLEVSPAVVEVDALAVVVVAAVSPPSSAPQPATRQQAISSPTSGRRWRIIWVSLSSRIVGKQLGRLDRVDALGRPRRDLVCWQILS